MGQFALNPAGGSYPLTADLNLGSSFGLLAPYYKSSSSTIATLGTLRLAKTDTIEWRNNANSADNILAVNGSDQLTFNGTPLATSGGGTVNLGTMGHLPYYATTSTTLSDASGHIISGTYTFSGGPTFSNGLTVSNMLNLSNQAEIAFEDSTNANEIFLKAPTTLGGSYTLFLPLNQGAANTFLKNDGSGNLSWATSSGSASYQQFYELVEHDLTATTYTNVGSVAVSLAASSNTAAIKLTVSTVVQNLTADQTVNTTVSVDGTNITVLLPGGSSKALSTSQAHSVTQISQISYSVVYVPGDTSSHTYQLQAQASSASTYAIGSNGNATTLIAEEIH